MECRPGSMRDRLLGWIHQPQIPTMPQRLSSPGKFFSQAVLFLNHAYLYFVVAAIPLWPARGISHEVDGFFTYCTSNSDGTGSCTNEEDGRVFTCIIVPGQIVSCQTTTSKAVNCVWISGVTANQAQFWCDADAEAAMYDNQPESDPPKSLDNKLPQSLDSSELQTPTPSKAFGKSF